MKQLRVATCILVLFLLFVGTASAAASFTNFATYGDGFISTNDTYTVIKWNTTGARTPWNTTGNVSADSVIEYVIVAGGGGGGKALGGGGGGAGAYWEGSWTNVQGAIPITVGTGGAQATANNTVGTAGAISIFHNITAMGGSGGGSAYMSNVSPGGSAGGAGVRYNGGAGNIWYTNVSNQTGHGNRGGFAIWNTTTAYTGGGGGGYSKPGNNATPTTKGGNGGNGSYTNITGTLLTLAGGGGGGTYSNTAAQRGIGGGNQTTGTTVGGSGGYRSTAATAAVVSTGSGGGGGGSTGAGTAGSAGVVIIRYRTKPNASFTANVTSGNSPLPVLFTDTSVNGTATSWNWSFKNVTGNNTEVWWSTTQNPSIAFGVGNWSIKLNATNMGRYNISSQTTFINVSTLLLPPVSSFTTNVTSGTIPFAVQFNDTSTNTPTQWNWSWGDANWTNGSTRNATKIYESAGNFSTFLISSNAAGSNQSGIQYIVASNATIGMLVVPVINDNSDARLRREDVNATFPSVRSGIGTVIVNNTGAITGAGFIAGTSASSYNSFTRYGWCGNATSAGLPAGSTITSGYFSVYAESSASAMGLGNISIGIGEFHPTNPLMLSMDDYNKTDFVRYSTDKRWSAGWSADGWNNYTLNAAGLANVSTTGTTCIMLMAKGDIDNSTSEITSWNAGGYSIVKTYDSNQTGTSKDPILTLDYTTSGGGTEYANWADFVVNSTQSLSDYQVKIILDNQTSSSNKTVFYTNGTTRSDWMDVKWTDTSNNTLSFWKENRTDTATNSTWWIKVPSIANNNSTKIRVHYGNASATTSLMDGTNTFIFFDDFPGTSLNMSKWSDGAGYTIADSVINITGSGAAWSYIRTSTDDVSGIVFGNNTSIRGRANLQSSTGGDNSANYGYWGATTAMFYVVGNQTITATGSMNTQTNITYANEYHVLEVSRGLDSVKTYVDNKFNTLHTTYFPTANLKHMIGWSNSYSGKKMYVDWTLVRKYNETEPFLTLNASLGGGGTSTPVASFTANQTSGISPLPVLFTDTSTNTPTAWNWSYRNVTGDNVQRWFNTSQNPVNVFTDGNYSIVLNASNSAGYNISTQPTWVNVSTVLAPVSSFTVDVTGATSPPTLQFNDTSTNIPTGWNWNFTNVTGNNTPITFSTSQNPTYQFGVGNFSIKLVASNLGGSGVSAQNTFINSSASESTSAPVASFTIPTTVVRMPNSLSPVDTSTNTPTSWEWSWGDGTANSTTQNPTHQYTKRGMFTINLAATNAGGTGVATAQTVRIVGYENYY